MSVVTNSQDMRKDAGWMQRPADDSILELLREYGNLSPKAVDEITGDQKPQRSQIGNRLPELWKHGFVAQISWGLYCITEDGLLWLDEIADAKDYPELPKEDRPTLDDRVPFEWVREPRE